MKGLSDMFNNFRFKVLFWFLSLLKLTVYNLPTHYVFFMYLSRFYRLCFKKFSFNHVSYTDVKLELV